MAAKRSVLKSQLPLILVAVTGVLLTVIYFIYRGATHNRCDSIFTQTTDRLGGNLEVIKIKGALVLGQEKIQELTEGSQKVALHLKTCCISQDSGNMSAADFQACVNGAREYEAKIAAVAANVTAADAAQQRGDMEVAKQKTVDARQVAGAASAAGKDLEAKTGSLAASAPVRAGAEQEANNTILQANVAEMGAAITAEIAPGNDVDFFQFQYRDAKNRRDIVSVHLENRSATLQPLIALYAEDKSLIHDWGGPNVAGGNANDSFTAEPDKKYYVAVASRYGTVGKYTLTVAPQKAWDLNEPNDDAFTATALKPGQTIDASIMDGADVDYYRLSGAVGNTVAVRLDNQSTTLRPQVRVLNGDKSILMDWSGANAQGADMAFSFSAKPGQTYFLNVTGMYGTTGRYKLLAR